MSDATPGRVLGIYLMTWGMLPFGQLAIGAAAAVSISALLALLAIALITHRFPARSSRLLSPRLTVTLVAQV